MKRSGPSRKSQGAFELVCAEVIHVIANAGHSNGISARKRLLKHES